MPTDNLPTLKLADDQALPCSLFGVSSISNTLYIDVYGLSMMEALLIFSDAEKTSTMVFSSGEESITRSGYIVLLGVEIIPDSNGIRVTMRKKFEGE